MTNTEFGRKHILVLAGLCGAGIILRVLFLGRSYWFDELVTLVQISDPNLASMLGDMAGDVHPPLYNTLAFGWSRLFGFSEIAVRSLSLLFGLAALMTPWIARRAMSRFEKLFVSAILCLMVLPIRYAQEARSYSLLLLLSCIVLFVRLEWHVTGRKWLTVAFHASLVALAFTHIFGLLLVLSFLAVIFFRQPGWRLRAGVALYAVALATAVIWPLLANGAGQLAHGHFWIQLSVLSVAKTFVFAITPVGVLLLAYAVFASTPAQGPRLGSSDVDCLLPYALMLAGAFAISINTPIITDRNLIGITPALALLCARLLQRAARPRAITVATAILGAMLLQAIAMAYSGKLFDRDDFRAIAQRSIRSAEPVCYLQPAVVTFAHQWEQQRRVMGFYTTKLYGHPELPATVVTLGQLQSASAARPCPLIADAHPAARRSALPDVSTLKSCRDVALADSAPGRTDSVLLDCSGRQRLTAGHTLPKRR